MRLAVYNMLGQEIRRLVEGERSSGYHEVTLDAAGLSSGVYIYRLQAHSLGPVEGASGDFVQARRLLLLR